MNDNRTLKRAYLDAPTRAGVFAIRHLPSGRLLVDGSPNAQAALNRHAFELRMKMHRNRDLQRDWSADGEAGFAFELLDVVKPNDDPAFDAVRELAGLVVLWREELAVAGPGYGLPARGPAPSCQ
jgi:hypothetical protein